MATEENPDHWVPEICYDDADDGLVSKIPFIEVPTSQAMPKILFIFESRETGDYEPGSSGEMVPIVDLDLHQYASMNTLRDNLPQATYNIIRVALGLESLSTAVEKGIAITDRVRENIAKS